MSCLFRLAAFSLQLSTSHSAFICPVRRFYVRQLNVDREQNGELHRRVKRMREVDPQIHREYFRMTKEQFDLILDKIRDRIAHKNNHRYPISSEERLAVTIRYVFFVFLMLLQWYQAASLEVRQ